jgi:hypothetical protein
MHFEHFHKFLEVLYVKKFDPERENLKRKVLAINFRLKKMAAGDLTDEPLRTQLMEEKHVLS